MTDLDLDRLLALEATATAAPWEYRDDDFGIYVTSVYADGKRPLDILEDGTATDQRLIAAARNALRPLLLRLQAAEAALLEITKCRDEFASAHVRGIARHGLGLPARREPRAAKGQREKE